MIDQQCSMCAQVYPIAHYPPGRKQCRTCRGKSHKAWRKENPRTNVRAGNDWSDVPADPRTTSERALDAAIRECWRYPVDPAQLRWAA